MSRRRRRPSGFESLRSRPRRGGRQRGCCAADHREEDAHRREPLLTVHDADGRDHASGAGLREGEQRPAVVTGVGSRRSYRQEVLDQPLDLALAPAIAALPSRDDVLNLAVEEFQELDLMGVHSWGVLVLHARRER